jgi:hypothetical protein
VLHTLFWLNEKSNKNKNHFNMEKKDAIKIFDNKKVRALWDEEHEQWYIAISFRRGLHSKAISVG